jgi:hypothetical protein
MQLNHQKRGGLVRQCYFAAQQVEAERIKHHLTRTQNGAVNAGTARGQEKARPPLRWYQKSSRKHTENIDRNYREKGTRDRTLALFMWQEDPYYYLGYSTDARQRQCTTSCRGARAKR